MPKDQPSKTDRLGPSMMSAKERARERIWDEKPAATSAERIARHLSAEPWTAALLAEELHLVRSTVTSALRSLESEGRAVRMSGAQQSGRRAADGWLLAEGGVPVGGKEEAGRKVPTPLRADVAAYLASATEPVSAHRIGKELGGRSAGAVQNVLNQLVDAGEAVLVTPRPKSYRAADGS